MFLVPYPIGESPSQRFRFEQYSGRLSKAGYTYHVQTFLDSKNWKYFFLPGNPFGKMLALMKGFLKRLLLLVHLPRYDWIFIHREVSPIGPPIFEWLIAKIYRKKIIYDFDDAIWLTDRKHESAFLHIVKWRSKVASICKWSFRVSGGNDYLCSYARQFNKNVVYNPTTIDTEHLHNPVAYSIKKDPDKVVIGWSGSHSTLKYLKELEPVLLKLETKYPELELLVIADKAPELAITNLRFLPWSFETEINGLLEADIGIMPLPDDEWAKGKCGFKALQYMALEIPAVASTVGVNASIITDNQNGFLCDRPDEWLLNLEQLIQDPTLRTQVGKAGRTTVISRYSVLANADNFLSLFLL